MNMLNNVLGKICKIMLPIHEEFYYGNPNSSIAVCTLSSIDLLIKFSNPKILNQVSIVGRLFSENKGIDYIVDHVNKNRNIDIIVVCGKEAIGHKAGHSLLALHKNGIDTACRIINSTSPDPYLTTSLSQIEYFRNHVTIINLINETSIEKILNEIT